MVWVKVVVLLLLLAAVISLFRGLMALVRGEGKDGKTARALTWRVIFCVFAFGLLLLSKYMGWIDPHDVNPTKRSGVPIEQRQAEPLVD